MLRYSPEINSNNIAVYGGLNNYVVEVYDISDDSNWYYGKFYNPWGSEIYYGWMHKDGLNNFTYTEKPNETTCECIDGDEGNTCSCPNVMDEFPECDGIHNPDFNATCEYPLTGYQ